MVRIAPGNSCIYMVIQGLHITKCQWPGIKAEPRILRVQDRTLFRYGDTALRCESTNGPLLQPFSALA